MTELTKKIESLLLYATKPMKRKALLKHTGSQISDLEKAVTVVKEKFNNTSSGIHLMDHDDALQFVTAPDQAVMIEKVFASEMTGELTKPALETLTIISYRGPINKPELELIRGVNCSLIIRNLMMRGLISESKSESEMMPVYRVAPEFLQFLGMTETKELPKFEELSSHQLLEELLKYRTEEST